MYAGLFCDAELIKLCANEQCREEDCEWRIKRKRPVTAYFKVRT